MPVKAPPFKLFFEIIFLENYTKLGRNERKSIDKAIKGLANNPRNPSLNTHKAKNVKGKYFRGGGGGLHRLRIEKTEIHL